jgi:hypothetical protein
LQIVNHCEGTQTALYDLYKNILYLFSWHVRKSNRGVHKILFLAKNNAKIILIKMMMIKR